MGVEETAPRNVPNSDELIHEEVHMILEHQPEIDTSDIDVSVRNGVVILEGSVREPLDMRHVDEAIQMVAGVQNLENRVRILQDGHPVEGIEYGSNERGKSGISDQRSGENPSDYQGQGTGRAKGQNT